MKKIFLQIFGLLMLAFSSFAQTKQIKGRVLDESGNGLAGVTVLLTGSPTGTQTRNDGSFVIAVPADGTVSLVFSSAGYLSQTVSTDGKSDLSVTLLKSITTLDDVVVIGYQTVRRRDLTGSVSSVNAKQLKDIPINNAAQALAGRLAGVQVTGTEGSPDAEVIIRVRGGGSITQDNSPLYIIDGIQVENALSVISPQDIESIDVLKDASATAIYGARGANGVVIITTKGGKGKKTTISYNGLFGVDKLANKLSLLKPYDFVMYQYERSRGSSTERQNFIDTYGRWEDLDLYKSVPFLDWQEEMFGRPAYRQSHNVSMAGGNGNTQYNLSLTYNKQDGIQLGSDFDRKLVAFKFDHTVSKLLKVGFNTRFNNTIVNGAGTSNAGSSSTNRLRHSIKYRPFLLPGQDLSYFDQDYADQTNANSLALVNPILLNQAEYRKNYTTVTNLSAYVDLRFTDFLSFKSTAGVDIYNVRQNAFDDTITGNSRLNGSGMPLANIRTSSRVTLNNSNVLTFSNAKLKGGFNEKNSISVLAGHEIYQTKTIGQNQFAREFPIGISPEKALGNMNLGTNYIVPGSLPTYENENHLVSFFGRVMYNYDERFLSQFTYRADGSSKFAQGNKWGYFPSGSVAWRISKERFFDKLSAVINDLKLRVSYGEAGNNRIDDFLYLTQFNSGVQYWINDQMVTGFAPEALANENLVWETTITRNLGLDLSFLKNRIQFSVDVYRNTTRDLLVDVPVPTSSGYTTQLQNVGSTLSKGVEFQLNAAVVSKKDFSWDANFNASFNRVKIQSLGTFQDFYFRSSGWGFSNTPADFIVREGDLLGTMWGFTTDGFYTLDDFDYANGVYTLKSGIANNKDFTSLDPAPGRLKFKDINNDGLISEDDKSIIGVAQPKIFGGLNQQFRYKNFDLSIFVNYQIGNDVLNANKLEFTNGYQPNANMLAINLDRWRTVDGQGNVVTDPVELAKLNANAKLWSPSTTSTSFVLHSWAVEDGSFLRINNITLGYNILQSLVKRIKFQNARAYFTVNNVAVITNYSGYDPEVSTRRRTPETPGVDYSAYPRSRSFIFGINFSL
ncbi:MAG: SusC/RagA family TonB-linked outer membrane protein [Terrimonas sp.]|nr:SusC/RagA family TonB-linked outer membrane protein [Terrimonas sp.]